MINKNLLLSIFFLFSQLSIEANCMENEDEKYYRIGKLSYVSGNINMAIKYYSFSIEKNKENHKAKVGLGACYRCLGDNLKAASYFTRAANDGNPEGFYCLGELQLKKEKAGKFFLRAAQKYLELGNEEYSFHCFEKAASFENKEALQWLEESKTQHFKKVENQVLLRIIKFSCELTEGGYMPPRGVNLLGTLSLISKRFYEICWDKTISRALIINSKNRLYDICENINNKSPFTRAYISYSFSEKDADAFATILQKSNITSLNGYYRIGDIGFSILANSLPQSKIKSIEFDEDTSGEEEGIGEISMQALSKVLPSTEIESLSFSHVEKIGDKEIKILADTLPQSKIVNFSLYGTKIGDAGAKALAEILPKTEIKIFNFGLNNVGDEGIKAIVQAAKHPQSKLTQLYLHNTKMGEEGEKVLQKLNSSSSKIKVISSQQSW